MADGFRETLERKLFVTLPYIRCRFEIHDESDKFQEDLLSYYSHDYVQKKRSFLLENVCATPSQHCRINNATHSGLWMLSPTECNCCEHCLPFYGEGEHCSAGGPGTGATIGRCGDGLSCVASDDGHHYCRRMQSECHKAQDEYDEREATGELGALEHRPHCDGKGKYARFDCVPAHTCFCQSEDGERLFGEVLYLGTSTTQNINCGCSRFHEKIKNTIAPGVPSPVNGPRCTAAGNFNPVQCIGRTCYCVDRITGEVLENVEPIDLDEKPISELNCYDPELDLFPQNTGPPPYNYTTPCFEDQEKKVEFILQSEKEGYNIDFFTSYPECLPDGTFGRISTNRNGSRICVDERGLQIGGYEVRPGTPEYENMDCTSQKTDVITLPAKLETLNFFGVGEEARFQVMDCCLEVRVSTPPQDNNRFHNRNVDFCCII